MKELSIAEQISINGGNVPTAYYMDDDVIKQNGKIMGKWLKIIEKAAEIVVEIYISSKV